MAGFLFVIYSFPTQTDIDAERAIIFQLFTTHLDAVPERAVIFHLFTAHLDAVPQWAVMSYLFTTQLEIVPQRALLTDLPANNSCHSLFDREVSRRYFDRAVLCVDLIHFDQ